MLLLPQVKRETLQATKYVELLLVADYAEVRDGIMCVPAEHRAQSEHPTCSISWSGEGSWSSPGFLLLSQRSYPRQQTGRPVSWSLLS